MQSALHYLTTASVFAVLAVLLMGLWVVMRGKSPNLSQKLMRWRVGLQFVAVVVIVCYVLARQYL